MVEELPDRGDLLSGVVRAWTGHIDGSVEDNNILELRDVLGEWFVVVDLALFDQLECCNLITMSAFVVSNEGVTNPPK